MKSTGIVVLLMITEEEISHQNNNIFDLSHPTKRALTPLSLNVKLGPRLNYHKGRANHNIKCLKCESASRRFQPGEGLLRDCENRLCNRWIVLQRYFLWPLASLTGDERNMNVFMS